MTPESLLLTLVAIVLLNTGIAIATSRAHSDLCKEWRRYRSKQAQRDSKHRRNHSAVPLDQQVVPHQGSSASSPILPDLLQDYTVEWPFDAQETHEARRQEQDEPLSILRQPLYYREQKRHFDLRDGPFVKARASSSSTSTDALALAAQGKYISPHGTIMDSAGWYLTAPQEDRRKVIHKMRKLWNFPEGPLGLLHAAMQAIVSITPEYAAYLLDPAAEQDLPLQMHIATMTFPRLTEKSELEQAALIKEQLVNRYNLDSNMADELILMALKFEGMKDAPVEIAVQHIKNKLEDPRQFTSDQFSMHRRRYQMYSQLASQSCSRHSVEDLRRVGPKSKSCFGRRRT